MKNLWLRIPILVLCAMLVLPVVSACTSAVQPTPTAAPKAPPTQPTKPAAEPAKPSAVPTPPAASTAVPKAAAKPLQAASARYGGLGSTADAPFYIALDKGYFKEQALAVEEVKFDSAARMIAPLAAGQLEVGGGTLSPGLFNAISRDIPLKIVADRSRASVGNGFQALVVRKDLVDGGQFKDATSLKGKTVAMPAVGVTGHVELGMLLENAKIGLDEVRIVEMGFPDMGPAFVGKAIDVAVMIEPFLTRGLEQGTFSIWKRSDEIYPDHQIAVVIYAPKFISDNPDAARRWMVAYIKGARDFNDAFAKKDKKARDEIIPILVKNTTVKDPAIWDKMVPQGVNPDGYFNVKSIEFDQEWYLKQGMIKQKLDINSIVDLQFVDYAVSQLGKYSK